MYETAAIKFFFSYLNIMRIGIRAFNSNSFIGETGVSALRLRLTLESRKNLHIFKVCGNQLFP